LLLQNTDANVSGVYKIWVIEWGMMDDGC
jgi:hypothetical protein